jgi:uncharacterized membrane protein YtjA (UPF0391 family)
MATANAAFRFVVELVGVGALGYWGLQAAGEGIARIVLAVGAPLALIVVWAIVVAPNATNPLSQPQRDVIGTALLLAAAVVLAAAGQPVAAVVFGASVAVNWALLAVLGPGVFGRPA